MSDDTHNLISARLIFRLGRFIPGTHLGTAKDIAVSLDADEDAVRATLYDLVALGWLTRPDGDAVFLAGRKAGTEWPTVKAAIEHMEASLRPRTH